MRNKPSKTIRFVLFVVLLALLPGVLPAQTEKITLPSRSKQVTDIFKLVEKELGYRFFYNDDVVGQNLEILFNRPEMTLGEILAEMNKQTGLEFKIMEDKLVVVSRAQAAQQGTITVKGNVTSASDDSPLPGVNVVLKGTTNGVVTNLDGDFQINVPADGILTFSFVGFLSEELPVQGKDKIELTMVEDIMSLDEVVVTALNINRTKSSLGYSISTVSGDEINTAKENNVINTLSGKVAGLQISRSSTGVDGSTRVILRGVSSILNDNRPLVVIDGIPVDAGHGGGGRWGGKDNGDALSDINPDDVENISILKGAGAAAAYGSRGANGVILITTKKGSMKKGLGVSLNTSYNLETPLLYPDFQNIYGHGAYGQYPSSIPDIGFPWGWSWGPKMEGQLLPDIKGGLSPFSPQPDNYRDFFRTGSSFINTLALESGTETSSVRASFTNQNSSGILPLNDLKRQTINLRGFAKMGRLLELDGKITYLHSDASGRPEVAEGATNPGYYLSIMPRNMVGEDLHKYMVNPDGTENLWTSDSYTGNPYWQLYKARNSDEKNRLQGVFSTKLNFTPKLNMVLRTGLDYTSRSYSSHVAKGSKTNNLNGYIGNSIDNYMEWNSDFMLNYSGKVNVYGYSFSAGGNYRYNNGQGLSQSGYNLRVNDYYAISNAGSYYTDQWINEKAVYSAYGLGQLSYKEWLYFDFTLRNDWSSTLPVNNNSYFYHSENLSFLFTNAFGIKSDILTAGKLRASYARVGNDTDPYRTKQYYSVYQSPLPYPVGGFETTLATLDLQPENTDSWEIGTNLTFFSGLLSLDLSYYNKISNNQIMEVTLPPSSGFYSVFRNAAKLQNHGLEVQMDVRVMSAKDFEWNSTITWAGNKSLVAELYQDTKSIQLDEQWFSTIQAREGKPFGEIYTYDFKRDNKGRVLVDDNGFVIKGDYKPMGNINPDWLAGFSNSFRYKNMHLSFLVDIRKGGDVYSIGKAYRCLFGTSALTLPGREEYYSTHDPAFGYRTPLPGVEPGGYIEKGINENTGMVNDVPVEPIYRWYNIWAKEIGAEWLLDGTNVRMREVQLGYSIPRRILGRTPLHDLTLSLVGRNLFFFYNAMGDIDPESGYSSANTGGGYEHSAIPTTRSIGFNIKVSF
ncbi:MAG: SusC/RagA family TonB-linked outer membrane protein [Bacteroidales bacterium]